MPDLRGRHFLKELDFTPAEWLHLLEFATELKAAKRGRREERRLSGRNIALIFEKTSTRTRCAFEVAAHDQGAATTYLDPSGSQLGHKESIADTARVLGRMYDAIEYRGFGQERVEELAAHAGVPVYNGLTDQWHPTQMLADHLTMLEQTGRPLDQISIAYLGDARFNVGNSVLVSCALMGMDVRVVAPAEFQPSQQVQQEARRLADASGAGVMVTDDVSAGVHEADFIYTDVWVSMGEPKDVWLSRVEALRPYQVNSDLLARTGNPQTRVLHCLPAFHDLGTEVGRQLHEATGMDALEVTDDVFEANAE
ncbi:MAG: ornithine carbamoyltransferase, partial [Brooklawnia sp.]